MDLVVSRPINMQKGSWPISSHLDLMHGQQPMYINKITNPNIATPPEWVGTCVSRLTSTVLDTGSREVTYVFLGKTVFLLELVGMKTNFSSL